MGVGTKYYKMRSILIGCLLVIAGSVVAQTDYSTRYENAKELFKQGKYNLAMESFKPLIPYDQNNPYSAYASFYYALAAYHQGYHVVAKDMLNQIRTVHASWNKTDEVNYWMARIHFDQGEYFQAMRILNLIRNKDFEEDIRRLKAAYIVRVDDAETLRMMLENYPQDSTVARTLARVLSADISDQETREELEALIVRFRFDRGDYIPEAPSTVHKDRYVVSLLMPFDLRLLDPSPGRKRNQVILDFYEGMKFALDTLQQQGLNVELRAYDSERSADRIKALLGTDEFRNTDLIVGPFFLDESAIVKEFSEENRINVIHPFSRSFDVVGNNPHSLLFQSSSQTLGVKSADFMARYAKEKKCFVFLGPGKQDSVLAFSFMKQAVENGINVIHFERVQPAGSRVINDILATPTEFDEFKYPVEFTLSKDSIDCIFVASDDPVIYTKVVGAVETRKDSILVMGTENWLEDNAIDLERYQSLGIRLAAPNFVDPENPAYKKFYKNFIHYYGRKPNNVARMGYELMCFVAHQLDENGVYFQQGLNDAGDVAGFLSEGFRYVYSRDNQLVPFIGIVKGQPTLIDKL